MKSLWLEGENFDVSPNLEPMEPIFHRLALGFCVMGNANSMFCVGGDANLGVFRYQHVGIPKAKIVPNAKGLASQWNIGLNFVLFFSNCKLTHVRRSLYLLSCSIVVI